MCDPGLCPDAPEDGSHCDRCPLDKLDAAQASEFGMLLRRAVDLHNALKLGMRIAADEFYAMLLLEQERDKLDRGKLPR